MFWSSRSLLVLSEKKSIYILHLSRTYKIRQYFFFQKSIEIIVDKFFIFSQGVCTVSKQQKNNIKYIKLKKSSDHHEKPLKMNSAHQELTGNWVLYIWSSLNICNYRFIKPRCCGPCSGGSLGTPANFCREAASTPSHPVPPGGRKDPVGPSSSSDLYPTN